MRARSENISLGGILLSSAFLIPEGSAVEVAVGVERLPDPGILLRARGRVLRVHPRISGDFAVAIKLERSFELPLPEPGSPSSSKVKPAHSPAPRKDRELINHRLGFCLAWHTET